MPFVPVPDTVLVEVRMELDSQKVENTLYFEGGSIDATAAAGIATGIIAWWVDNYSPITTTALALREVVVTDLSSDTGFQVSEVPDGLVTGTISTSPAFPNSVSLAVSFRTANRGRSFRGRNYVVGITDSQVTLNTMDPTTVSAWHDAYTALLATAASLSVEWVVVSRFSGVDPTTRKPIPRATGITTPVTTVVVTDPTVDSQRRRLPGRGK
jgi:hypothetical protein